MVEAHRHAAHSGAGDKHQITVEYRSRDDTVRIVAAARIVGIHAGERHPESGTAGVGPRRLIRRQIPGAVIDGETIEPAGTPVDSPADAAARPDDKRVVARRLAGQVFEAFERYTVDHAGVDASQLPCGLIGTSNWAGQRVRRTAADEMGDVRKPTRQRRRRGGGFQVHTDSRAPLRKIEAVGCGRGERATAERAAERCGGTDDDEMVSRTAARQVLDVDEVGIVGNRMRGVRIQRALVGASELPGVVRVTADQRVEPGATVDFGEGGIGELDLEHIGAAAADDILDPDETGEVGQCPSVEQARIAAGQSPDVRCVRPDKPIIAVASVDLAADRATVQNGEPIVTAAARDVLEAVERRLQIDLAGIDAINHPRRRAVRAGQYVDTAAAVQGDADRQAVSEPEGVVAQPAVDVQAGDAVGGITKKVVAGDRIGVAVVVDKVDADATVGRCHTGHQPDFHRVGVARERDVERAGRERRGRVGRQQQPRLHRFEQHLAP